MSKLFYTVPYEKFYLWDAKRYNCLKYNSIYPICPLGDHINNEIEKIKLNEFPETQFSILGISNELGMYDAYNKLGKEFNQPYKIIKDNFIAYNPYRVNIGSIGIKKSNLRGNLISPAYVVFSCKNTLLPDFLFLLMKTNRFNELVRENTSGSVRQNLTFDALSRIEIPIPSIDKQREILEIYFQNVKNKEDGSLSSWDKLSDLYINSLGAYAYDYKQVNNCFFGTIYFEDLLRWDEWKNSFGVKSNKYKIVPFEKLILHKPQYGANTKGVDEVKKYRYIRITDINEDGTLNSEIKYPGEIDESFILEEDDFLIARSGNTVGKTFLYKDKIGPSMFAGYLVKYILNKNIIIPEYLLYYTKTKIFKNWVLQNQRISGQPNINGQEYLSFPVILPSINIQKQIASEASKIVEDIRFEKNSIMRNLENAKNEFEKALYL